MLTCVFLLVCFSGRWEQCWIAGWNHCRWDNCTVSSTERLKQTHIHFSLSHLLETGSKMKCDAMWRSSGEGQHGSLVLTDNQAGSIERKLLPYSKENKQFYLKTARNWAKEVKRPFSKIKVYMFKYILNLGKPSKIGAWLFYIYIAFLLASYHCAWKREKLTSTPGSCVYITAYWSWSW